MKLTKKLIPALGMLLLSACMMVTSTFAWFSMNTDVSATGMKVTAVGDQVYLQIGLKGELFESTTLSYTTVQGAAATNALRPTAVVKSINAAADANSNNTVTNYTKGSDGWKWVTNNSSDINSATAAGNYVEVPSNSVGNYYLVNEFDIRLDPKAGLTEASGSLRVSGVSLAVPADKTNDALGQCVSVFVVAGTCTQLWKQTTAGEWYEENAADNGVLTTGNFTSTEGAATTVQVYVFFDGQNEQCKISNYKNAVNDYTVSVSFTVAPPTQNN